MSAVIHALWIGSDSAPLIMPGGVPFDYDDVLSEISQYLEDHFKPVIATDIDGDASTPARIDASRSTLGTGRVTRRIARAIFLGSAATLKAAHKGIERPSIWLGIATPGDTIGNFANALSLLSDQATYLYSEGARYWYSVAPSIQKMAREHADRLKDRPEETWAEILDRLKKHEQPVRGMFARVQIGPERSEDIPEEPAVRLVIMHPQYRHARGDVASSAMIFATSAAAGRGSAHRLNRNMIVFLAATASGMRSSMTRSGTTLPGRTWLAARNGSGTSTCHRSKPRRPEAAKEADETVAVRISASYQWLLIPALALGGQLRIEESKADTTRDRLAERARTGSATPTSCAPCKARRTSGSTLTSTRCGHGTATWQPGSSGSTTASTRTCPG